LKKTPSFGSENSSNSNNVAPAQGDKKEAQTPFMGRLKLDASRTIMPTPSAADTSMTNERILIRIDTGDVKEKMKFSIRPVRLVLLCLMLSRRRIRLDG
jgi:hypothetical protein